MKKIKCWKISPYHNSEADFCIIRAETEKDHQEALQYAKNRLEELWDESAFWDNEDVDQEDREFSVTMKEIYLDESEIPQ